MHTSASLVEADARPVCYDCVEFAKRAAAVVVCESRPSPVDTCAASVPKVPTRLRFVQMLDATHLQACQVSMKRQRNSCHVAGATKREAANPIALQQRLRVRDLGKGIGPIAIEHIADRFHDIDPEPE